MSVPHLDGVVPESTDDLAVVILQTVHPLAVLTPAVDPLQVVLPAPPVVLDGVDVLDDAGVESPIEGVRGVRLPGLRFEQVLDPPENNKQFTSKSMPMTKRSVEVKTVELSSQLESQQHQQERHRSEGVVSLPD